MISKFRKFRAWHKELKAMLYPPNGFDSMLDCRDSSGNHRSIEIESEDWSTGVKTKAEHRLGAHVTWDGRWYVAGKYQDVIWMQYIGLKTQDDIAEIFEGDILKYKDKIGEVRYEPDYGGYILEFAWSKHQHHQLLGCDVACRSEKLGNIYQNPELLKP